MQWTLIMQWNSTTRPLDNSPLPHGQLMELSFYLCSMYYNWSGAIRVPSVCQYAHKIAFLAGDSLGRAETNPALAETLFYL